MAAQFNPNSKMRPLHDRAFDARDRDDGAVKDTAVKSARLPLRLQYLPSSAALPCAGLMPLAEIHFAAESTVETAPHPRVGIAMAPLDGVERIEVWASELPVCYAQADDIHYATNGEVLFGLIRAPSTVDGSEFDRYVWHIYQKIFALTESQGYPHLLRMWNYFPSINVDHDGLENYQRFCRARSLAFQARYNDFIDRLPSASAIGAQRGALVMYFIAAREPGVYRENPRQISAYSYPPQYGPRSPSFARATLKRFHEHEFFFISGTASIVGHESLHVGDVRAQLEETLRNIDALIESTKRDEATHFRGLDNLSHLKVYLRHAADLDIAREMIQARIGTHAEVLYLLGDICRRELLVEIEAVIGNR